MKSKHFLSHISVWDMHTSWVKGLVSVDDMTYWLSDSNDKNMDPHFPKSGHCTSRRNREITSPQSLHYLSLCLPLVSLIKLFTDSFANTFSGLSVAHTNVCAHFHTQRFLRIVIFAPHASLKNQTKNTFPPSHGFASSKYTALSSIYLNDRMASGRCFDGSSASFRLVVGPVMLSGLNLYSELILLTAAGERPVQRWQGCHWHTKRWESV